MESDLRGLSELVKKESAFIDRLFNELGKTIVGQQTMIERLLIGLLCRGHILLEGVPGLAKTLTVNTLAKVLDLSFSRIQFTPDLLPADVVGTRIFLQSRGDFEVRKGPVFANIVLADEINRAPAKVQSALLESMQEYQVTIGSETYPLPKPFFVLATQNPIEQEGTYPLPEAQLDRFMLMVKIDYPSREEEKKILGKVVFEQPLAVDSVISVSDLERAQQVVSDIYVDDKIKDYAVDVVRASRIPHSGQDSPNFCRYLNHGASPRASIALVQAARANAFIQHRAFVTPEDVKSVGPSVLCHRIALNYEADAEDIRSDDIVQMIFDYVQIP